MNCQTIILNIRNNLNTYLNQYPIKSLILGLSGGIDSALCAALAKPVCDKHSIPLIGRSIAIETNKNDEIERGDLVGANFCHNYKNIDLTEQYHTLLNTFSEIEQYQPKENALRNGNIKARLRMIYLYNLSQKYNGMVISTDNYTEYLLGFWTLHGDVGDYGPIQSLWKTEVYQLSKWLANNELSDKKAKALNICIEATPTDGLGITNSDYEQLGAENYTQVDAVLQEYTGFKKPIQCTYTEQTKQNIINRHIKSTFKRTNPYNISRKSLFLNQE